MAFSRENIRSGKELQGEGGGCLIQVLLHTLRTWRSSYDFVMLYTMVLLYAANERSVLSTVSGVLKDKVWKMNYILYECEYTSDV